MACFIFSAVLLSSADSARAQTVCSAGSATGNNSTACGIGAEAAGNNGNTSIGADAGKDATGSVNQFFGFGAGLKTMGSYNTATGYLAGSGTTGDNNIAIGVEAGIQTSGDYNVAIGNQATTIGGSNATAVGANTEAHHTGSTALGTGAITNAPNQMMFGTNKNTYVMQGLPKTPGAAGDQFVTVDPTGQLRTTSFSVGALGAGLSKALSDIDDNTEGIAVAIAMGGLVLPQGKNFAIAGNAGFYDDKQALAANAAIRVDDVMTLNAGVGVGLDNNKVGGRVGFMAAW